MPAAAGRWWLSPALRLQWTKEKLTAHTDDARPPTVVPPALVGLLDTFKQPLATDEGVRLFLERYADDEDDPNVIAQLEALIAQFQQAGVLVDHEAEVRPRDEFLPGKFARPDVHVMMLRDYVRTATYREAISRHVRDKAVVEIGCGSGVLACFAAKAGARRVYAIEETAIIDVAREVVRANGLDDRVEFIHSNSALASVPEPADIVYSEIIGSDPLGERILPSLRDASERFLAPGGRMIPRRISIFAVCMQSAAVDERRANAVHRYKQAQELSTVYNLDLSPLVDAYGAQLDSQDAESQTYARLDLPIDEGGDTGEAFLSDGQLLGSWDLTEARLGAASSAGDLEVTTNSALDEVLRVRMEFRVNRAGVHNAACIYFTVELDDDLRLSNSPFAPQVPVNWGGQAVRTLPDLDVSPGDTVELNAIVDPAVRPVITFLRTQ